MAETARTVLRCCAQHPVAAKRREAYQLGSGQAHGYKLGIVPWKCAATRVLRHFEEVLTEEGRFGVLCPVRDCGAVTEFEVLPPDDEGV